MPEILLRKVGDKFLEDLAKGVVKVVGSTVRDQDNIIRGHLEEVGLTDILNPNIKNQLGSAIRPHAAKILGSIDNVQSTLGQMLSTLGGLSALSWVNVGLNVVNIGVSMVGFAMVNRKLNRITDSLDSIGAGLAGMWDDMGRNFSKPCSRCTYR